ncbi:MAG TPA: 50S ribosomal protein L29 [Bryobacteraceae bacterium]|nr:50S ribosomal protein L29 [Bryobacteraceae bacterium]
MKENADKARALDSAEIHKQLRDSSEQMFRLRFLISMGQMDGLKKLRLLRRERARMLTVLRERELHPEGLPRRAEKSVGAEATASKKAKSEKPVKAVRRETRVKPAKAAHPKTAAPKAAKPKAASKEAKPKAAAVKAAKPNAAAKKAPVKKAAAKKAK